MKKGFTLIELMIVVAIIAVIAAIAIPSLIESTMAANEGAAVKSLATYATAQEQYKKNNFDGDNVNNYASSFTGLNGLADAGGNTVDLLGADFVAATAATAPFKGYYFNDIADWAATRNGFS